MGPLISADALAGRLGDDALVVIDCRHDLARPDAGESAWASAFN